MKSFLKNTQCQSFLKKQNLIYKTVAFFVASLSVLFLSSCCKAGDCECHNNCNENQDYQEYFIAHAGGAIDGINYTNCVEALDLSYSKGCKLFELDLKLSTDGKIVATHESSDMPEAEFMNRLIEGKYTPMNIDAINLWFRNHPDAILVTDKINDPERVCKEFLFLDRLIMELFTWKEVDKAIELGIKPMVSENLIFGNSQKAIELGIEPIDCGKVNIEIILAEKNIQYICMSYRRIAEHKNLLKRMKENGIKNYVFHLENPISGQPGEQYIWENEMKYCYGMYANDLDLLTSLLIKK